MILEMQMWHLDNILLHITAHDQIIPLSEMKRFTGVNEILTQHLDTKRSTISEVIALLMRQDTII
jgi:hypothetical protein